VDTRRDFAKAFGRSFTGWGASWIDLDLDTDLDLVLANGQVPVASLVEDAEPVQVLENLTVRGHRARFVSSRARPGSQERRRINGRGLAAADFDNDGDLDIAVWNRNEPVTLLRNDSTGANAWIQFEAPLHTRVTLTLPGDQKFVQEVLSQSSFYSAPGRVLHFGAGTHKTVDAVVRSANGSTRTLRAVPVNKRHKL
jgi:hypothetical protein